MSNINDIAQYFEIGQQLSIDQTFRNSSSDMDLINSLTECLDKIKLLDYHYSCANLQRKSYIEAKKNLKEDEILIEFDFKQKIKIGLSPRQVSSEFYRDKSRYVLGIGIYYRKNS